MTFRLNLMYDPWPIGIWVGRKPFCDNQGARISGFNIVVISSHAKSLCVDVLGMLNSHPPINVEVLLAKVGTGNIGIKPTLCFMFLLIGFFGNSYRHP